MKAYLNIQPPLGTYFRRISWVIKDYKSERRWHDRRPDLLLKWVRGALSVKETCEVVLQVLLYLH